MSTSADCSRSRPRIAIFQFSKRTDFDEQYGDLIQSIRDKADVRIVDSPKEAKEHFKAVKNWPVTLVVDDRITEFACRRQKHAAVAYVRSGGTLVLGCHFPCLDNVYLLKEFFLSFGLPWVPAHEGYHLDYRRKTFCVNRTFLPLDHAGLLHQYNQEALQIENVKTSDALYTTESLASRIVFMPSVGDMMCTSAAAAFAAVGLGNVGYVGDVNGEDGTKLAILAMLGLNT